MFFRERRDLRSYGHDRNTAAVRIVQSGQQPATSFPRHRRVRLRRAPRASPPQRGRLAPSGHRILSSVLITALCIANRARISVSAVCACRKLPDIGTCMVQPRLARRRPHAATCKNCAPSASATLNSFYAGRGSASCHSGTQP